MAGEPLRAVLEQLGGWEGFEIAGLETEDALEPDAMGQPAGRLIITLRPRPDTAKRCSQCGGAVREVHDVTTRRVRDLPVLGRDVWLVIPRARLECPRCGPTVEDVPWLDRYARMTKRLVDQIARLAQVLPIKHVAQWFGVHWDTVKQIDARALARRLGPITPERLAGVRYLAIDEFAIQKGHRYATVVVDAEHKRVLWVARGRDRAALRPFFERMGVEGRAGIQAVAMDMSGPFTDEVRAQCPSAAIVYDLFHVVAKYGREVIDRVRVDETNRIARANGPNDKATRAARRVIKGTRWLLLRNRESLRSPADRVRLTELLRTNRALFITYVLRDDLKQLWRYRSRWAAARFWKAWYRRARASRVAPLQRFAERLKPYVPDILSHCRYPLNTAIVEGINNKIKVLKRMAYGYRDDAYFFLKIRAAFPGIP